ncbi:hypothetical protein FRC10_010221 [Ceratobasidium sp. 414]|nr:hypothetical protein FRC10_010221 [Ceratobasidium sp. 414]
MAVGARSPSKKYTRLKGGTSAYNPRSNRLSIMAQPPLKHLVVVTGFAVSHVRPCLNHFVRLAAKFPNLFISVYTPGPLAPQADAYLAAYHNGAHDRVRVVPSIADIPIATLLDLVTSMERSFGPWIAEQLASPSAEINGLIVEAPSYIIEDHINGGIAAANKKHHGLPIAAWWVSTAASFMAHFGNAEHGGGWRRVTAVREAMKNQEQGNEKTYEEVFAQELTDRVVCIPGLPPHYEHEQMPQSQPLLLPTITQIHGRWMAVEDQVDLAVFNSVYEMEPIAAEAVANTLSKPITALCIGLAADLPPVTPQLDPSTSDPVLAFMNRAYTDLGAHSVIYAAFGNFFFPPVQSLGHLKIVIEEIIAQGLRLVFVVKPENAKITGLDEEYLEKLTKGGNAIFPEWTKQLEVLEHPGDQPTNAMQIARQLDCGFELIQIRTGSAKSVAFGVNGDIPIVGSDEDVRGEIQRVFKMSKGERGAQQRLNIQALGKLARESSMPGGSADVALETLGKAIGL